MEERGEETKTCKGRKKLERKHIHELGVVL
jgi:hypothetical protein